MEHNLQHNNTKTLYIKVSKSITIKRSFLILEGNASDEQVLDKTETYRVSLDNITSYTAWLFDISSSVHICNDQRLFTNQQLTTRKVLVTGGGKVYPSGRGITKVCFIDKLGSEVPISLTYTALIPEFPVNVMSGLRLDKNEG